MPFSSHNPFTGRSLYADPYSQAAQFCAEHPHTAEALAIRQIATQPQAFWLESKLGDLTAYLHEVLSENGTELCVFVIYNIPQRDNGGYSAGGLDSFLTYCDYIDSIVEATQNAAPVFIVEPDALAHASLLPDTDRALRYQCLSYAIARLATVGTVYLDIGHAAWHGPDEVIAMLQPLTTDAFRGFSINVSNFLDDATNQAYAQRLFALIGKPCVTDTSRNGNGPAPENEWCNPAGRALGRPPLSFQTAAVDANLWIKRPGESDGACHGGPAAGVFWPAYAVSLIENGIKSKP